MLEPHQVQEWLCQSVSTGRSPRVRESNRITGETCQPDKANKTLFESLWNKPGDPIERIKSLGLEQIDDSNALEAIVNTVIKQNSDQVEQLKNGKTKVLGYLVGQIMKETSGKANPKKVNELIRTILEL